MRGEPSSAFGIPAPAAFSTLDARSCPQTCRPPPSLSFRPLTPHFHLTFPFSQTPKPALAPGSPHLSSDPVTHRLCRIQHKTVSAMLNLAHPHSPNLRPVFCHLSKAASQLFIKVRILRWSIPLTRVPPAMLAHRLPYERNHLRPCTPAPSYPQPESVGCRNGHSHRRHHFEPVLPWPGK